MLHLETRLGVYSEHNTGTDMGHVCLLDERGDNGTFTNTLWEVQSKFSNKDNDRKKKLVPSPTSNMRTSLRMLSFFSLSLSG